jgi:hypothetical protein
LSEVIGSWKMIAISLARTRRISSLLALTRSRPCQSTSPAAILPGGIGRSFSTVIAVTVLPQPDSPTTQTVSPRSIVRSTPSTAWSQPSSVLKCVFNPLICSSGTWVRRPCGTPERDGDLTSIGGLTCADIRAPGADRARRAGRRRRS